MIRRNVTRSYPWNTVPSEKQTKIRRSRFYYLLTIYLRENPPDTVSFRIKILAEEFGASYMSMYQTARNYHFDSKYFLARIPIPSDIQGSEHEWEWAINQLHSVGFYFIQPLYFKRGWWGEPTFRQFEDYDTLYIREAFNRVLLRLQNAKDFGLTFDGLDIRKELDYAEERRRMLRSSNDDDD